MSEVKHGFERITANINSLSKRKTVCGVGINDAWYVVSKIINGKNTLCPVYIKWSSMIRRCNLKKALERNPTYIGCTICEEWLTFSNFLEWVDSQDIDIRDLELDKDLKNIGNKEYSPDNCLFITMRINKFMCSSDKIRGEFKQGVSWDKRDEVFKAKFMVGNKKDHVGSFGTEEEAFLAYKEYKMQMAIKLGDKYPHLKQYLINYVDSIK